jgi:hypothetical protein
MAAAAAPQLEGRLSSAEEHRTDEPIRIRFELTNRGDRDVYFLKWLTPLEGLFSDCLEVAREGQGGEVLVEYDGRLVKRGSRPRRTSSSCRRAARSSITST